MSEQTANTTGLGSEKILEQEYEQATARVLHDEAEEQRKRNRQDYSMYLDEA